MVRWENESCQADRELFETTIDEASGPFLDSSRMEAIISQKAGVRIRTQALSMTSIDADLTLTSPDFEGERARVRGLYSFVRYSLKVCLRPTQ